MAHISLRPRLGALGAGMLLAATAAAQNKPAAPNTTSPTTNAAAPAVAEQADRFIKEMSAVPAIQRSWLQAPKRLSAN